MKTLLSGLIILCFTNTGIAQSWADSTEVQNLPSVEVEEIYFPMDRPSQTFNAQTAAQNTWILQMGVNWGSLIKTKQSQDYDAFSFPINLRYGITDKLEVMLSPSPAFGTTVGGGGGIEYTLGTWDLALRYSLFKNTKAGSMSVLGSYTYQNYESGVESQDKINLKILYSISLGRYLTLGSNLGYVANASSGDEFSYTVIASFALTNKFGFYVEGYGSVLLENVEAAKNPSWFDAGLYYRTSPTFQLDAGYAQGGAENYNDFYTYVGFSYLFGKGK